MLLSRAQARRACAVDSREEADMNNFYNSGGVPPLPPHLQDSLRKCGECGHVFVGSTISPCPACAGNQPKDPKEKDHELADRSADPIIVGHIRRPGAPRYAAPLTFFVAWWLDYTDL